MPVTPPSPLNAILSGAAALLVRATRHSARFVRAAERQDVCFELATTDGRVARAFTLRGGQLSTHAGRHASPDFAIELRSARFAASLLARHDRETVACALASGDIRLRGDIAKILWTASAFAALRQRPDFPPRELATVGFVGVGFIGAPMARSLARAGFDVRAVDTNPAALAEIASYGVDAHQDLARLEGAQAVVVMVNNMRQVESVVLALANGPLRNAPAPVIVMSTVSPDDIVALRAQLDALGHGGLPLLDAPVSGAPLLAEVGKLSVMVGGDEAVFERVRPVLDTIGDPKKVFYLGELGRGSAMKLLNNAMAMAAGLSTFECLALGVKFGFSPQEIGAVVRQSSGTNFLIDRWPLTAKMLQWVAEDSTYNAKEALFVTGMKDLHATRAWAEGKGVTMQSVDGAIRQIESMDSEAFSRGLSEILSGDDR